MSVFAVAVLVGLVCAGVAAGDMFCTTVGLAPMMQSLSYSRYVDMVQFLQPRYDPAMPIINLVALLAGVTAAALAPTVAARVGFVVAALLVAAVIAISVARAVPINRYVVALDRDREPADWPARDPRRTWRVWNRNRTVLMIGALVAQAATVAALL